MHGELEIIAEHALYQKGLMYFLANDPRVPEDVRVKFSQWGLAADEFFRQWELAPSDLRPRSSPNDRRICHDGKRIA